MRVLLVEDNSTLARRLELELTSEGMQVYTTDLGEEGIDLAKLYDYDVIIFELELPDMSGFDVLRSLRTGKVQTPVIILSKISFVEAKVKAFNDGADDYVTKPYHKDELVARIKAVARRYRRAPLATTVTTGKLNVNIDAKTAEVAGFRVPLTSHEYRILELLSLRKGTTVTKDMFMNHLYSGMDEPEEKIINVFITKLRKKIGAATKGDNYIETVRGAGYELRDPPS